MNLSRACPLTGHRVRNVTVASMGGRRASGPGLGSDSPLLLGRNQGKPAAPLGKLIMPGMETRPKQRIIMPDNIAPDSGSAAPFQLNKCVASGTHHCLTCLFAPCPHSTPSCSSAHSHH